MSKNFELLDQLLRLESGTAELWAGEDGCPDIAAMEVIGPSQMTEILEWAIASGFVDPVEESAAEESATPTAAVDGLDALADDGVAAGPEPQPEPPKPQIDYVTIRLPICRLSKSRSAGMMTYNLRPRDGELKHILGQLLDGARLDESIPEVGPSDGWTHFHRMLLTKVKDSL